LLAATPVRVFAATRIRIAAVALFSGLALAPAAANGQTITAAWDPSPPSSGVTGYQVCIGTSSLSCNVALASVAGSQTSHTFSPPTGVLVYVAVRAVSAAGLSPYSSEAAFSIPGLAQPPNRSNAAGAAITPVSLPVSDPDGSALTFVHTGLPLGLTLNQSTGQITGTPTSPGTYNVVVFVSDNLVTVSRSFSWTITSGGTSSGTSGGASGGSSGDSGGDSGTGGGTGSGGSTGASSVSAVSVTPSSGTGLAQTFTLRYSDSAGAGNLGTAWALLGGTPGSFGNACMVRYDAASGALQLLDDTATSWSSSPIGSGAPLSNGQCVVKVRESSASPGGTTLTLNLSMLFSTVYGGSKGVYMHAVNRSGQPTGWQLRGSWVVAYVAPGTSTSTSSGTSGSSTSGSGTGSTSGSTSSSGSEWTSSTSSPSVGSGSTVRVVGVSPSGGASYAQTFRFQFSDSTGGTRITTAWMDFKLRLTDWKCVVRYDRNSRMLQLLGDNGVTWSSAAPGSGVLANSQCVVQTRKSTVSTSGTGLTIDVAMVFSTGYAGALSLRAFADNDSGLNSGWITSGSWTVGSTPLTPSGSTSSGSTLPGSTSSGSTSSGSGSSGEEWSASSGSGSSSSGSAVRVLGVTPSTGSGYRQTFRLQISAAAGAQNVKTAWLDFRRRGDATWRCLVRYERATQSLQLLDDSGQRFVSAQVGSATPLANSQCVLQLTRSAVGASGSTLTLDLGMVFATSYAGTLELRTFADDTSGNSSGWQVNGTWIVP
jgi:hypothetical protein